MICSVAIENDFTSWRTAARKLLQRNVLPDEILWTSNEQNFLFANGTEEIEDKNREIYKVSADFLQLAEAVACFDDANRWSLLYRLLYRLIHENKNLLCIESDEDVRQARLMEKAVGRDVHKFHAFVRFRRIETRSGEIFIAWHVPAHFTVARATPFFARRFGAMCFSILTPKGCAHWNLENLSFSEGVTKEFAPQFDETEEFWLAYYQAIFNPFRLKIKAMKAELPVRHWRTLPEAVLIPKLISDAKKLKR